MPRLPKKSLVVVTGANGYIGSHIVDQLLQAGFDVRAAVRDLCKSQWLEEYVEATYGAGRIESFVVPDLAADATYDEVVKGASAFIHAATINSFDEDPEQVIPGVVKGAESALKACLEEPLIQQFVYTSSSGACLYPKPNTKIVIDKNTWNEESLKQAYEEGPKKAMHVYCASKALAEKSVWAFQQEQRPNFTINTVVPNLNWGKILAPEKSRSLSSGGLVPAILTGGLDSIGPAKAMPPQYHIDVQDTARLHVAPLLDSTIASERLFAFNEPFNLHDVLQILRRLRPERRIEGTYTNVDRDLTVIGPRPMSELLLKDVFARPGFTSLEESIIGNIAHIP